MTTDTSEAGLEALIVAQMTGAIVAPTGLDFADEPEPFVGLHNWLLGNPADYDRAWTADIAQLRAFLSATQPHLTEAFDVDNDGPVRQKFLARLQGEVGKRGVINILRHGIRHGPHELRSSMARLRPAIRSQSAVPPTASRSRASLTRSCSTSRTTQRRSKKAFEPYYRTTILSDETDPNKLHDLKSALDGSEVYDDGQIEQLVALYLGGADRDKLDPILDACVAIYKDQLDEDDQVSSAILRGRTPTESGN